MHGYGDMNEFEFTPGRTNGLISMRRRFVEGWNAIDAPNLCIPHEGPNVSAARDLVTRDGFP